MSRDQAPRPGQIYRLIPDRAGRDPILLRVVSLGPSHAEVAYLDNGGSGSIRLADFHESDTTKRGKPRKRGYALEVRDGDSRERTLDGRPTIELDGWVTIPMRGQLDSVGPEADADPDGGYPLTVSLRRDAVPQLLHALVKATVQATDEEERKPAGHTAAMQVFADQLCRAYDWRSLAEREKEDPDAAQAHREAAEELWPWLAKAEDRDRREKFQRGYDRGRQRGFERAREEFGDDTAHMPFASEFRIPCPPPDPAGHDDLLAQRRPDDLIVRRSPPARDGWENGWLILNPNLPEGDHVWTGTDWVYRGRLHRNAIYKWTRTGAITEAQRLAAEETKRFEAWVAETRAGRVAQGGQQ